MRKVILSLLVKLYIGWFMCEFIMNSIFFILLLIQSIANRPDYADRQIVVIADGRDLI